MDSYDSGRNKYSPFGNVPQVGLCTVSDVYVRALWNFGKYFQSCNETLDVCSKPAAHFDEGVGEAHQTLANTQVCVTEITRGDSVFAAARARGPALNVRRLPRGVAAATSCLHLDANESGAELARALRLLL